MGGRNGARFVGSETGEQVSTMFPALGFSYPVSLLYY